MAYHTTTKKVSKKKKGNHKQNNNIAIPKYKNHIAYLIIAFMVCIPWISRFKQMKIIETVANVFGSYDGYLFDEFLYYKEIMIITIAGILLFIFMGEHLFPDHVVKEIPLANEKNKKIIILVLGYIVLAILSTLVSKYRSDMLLGAPTECEGIFTLISYMVLFLAGINYFNYEKVRQALIIGIDILAGITIVLSAIEFLYKPLFEISLFQKLLLAGDYADVISNMKMQSAKQMVSLTFYNANYFGTFVAMIFPIVLCQAISCKQKYRRYIELGLAAGLIPCVIESKSSGPVYVVLAEMLVILVWAWMKKQNRWTIGLSIGISVLMILLMNVFSGEKLLDATVNSLTNPSNTTEEETTFVLTDIQINSGQLLLIGEEATLDIEVKDNVLSFKDGNGSEVTPVSEDGAINFTDERYQMIKISSDGSAMTIDLGYDEPISFYVNNGKFYGVGQNGQAIKNVSRENRMGEQYYSLFTGRGYTWINSLSLLKSTLLLGKGPDTFGMYFQQNDYVGLLNTHGTVKKYIDKAHNMYLQTAIQTGAISLIILLIIWTIVLYRGGQALMKNHQMEFDGRNGIYIAVIGFLILGIINDSIVTTSPIFWILCGTIISFTDEKQAPL